MFKKLFNKYNQLPVQARASFWFFICAFLQKGISSITTPIFTRLLSTSEYGQFSVFNSWLSIVTIFVSLNLYYGVYMQGLVKFKEEQHKYTSSLQGLTLTLVLGWTVIYLIRHNFWNKLFSLTTVQMLAMLVMIWTGAVFQFWSSEQRTNFKYRKLVALTILVSIAKPGIGIFFVMHAEDKVTARILGLALVELVAYTGLFFVQMFRGKQFFSKKYWKYVLGFALPLIPHYLSMSILSSSDRIMISRMTDNDKAGIYNLAYSISLIMTMFNTALLQTLEPWLYKRIKSKNISDIKKVAYPAFVMIAAINVALIAFAPEIVAIFAPLAYYDAIWVIPPVAMSVYFMFAYSFFAVFEFYYEKTRFIAIATSIGAVLNVILNYIFIQIFDYYAAGYTTLVCYIVYAGAHYFSMLKVCKMYLGGQSPYKLQTFLLITLAFIALGFVFLISYSNTLLRYVLVFGILIAIIIKRKLLLDSINQLLHKRQ